MIMRIISLIALLASLAHGAGAATYYVDFETGSDAANGTSDATPWKHCPGDPNATGTADTTALVAGDTVLFKGGTTYVFSTGIILSWSGSAGNPITYDGSTWGGPTRCIITNNQASAGDGMTDSGTARSYLTIKNLHFKDIAGRTTAYLDAQGAGTVASGPEGSGIALTGGGTTIIIDNVKTEGIGLWQNHAALASGTAIGGSGISVFSCDTVTIQNCETTKSRIGIQLKTRTSGDVTLSNIVVDNCNIHNYHVWGIDLAPRSYSGVISNVTISDTAVYDIHEYDSGNWLGAGEKPHSDNIFVRSTAYGGTWSGVVIERCHFYSDNYASSNGGTAAVYISQGPSVTVRNCLFANLKHTRAIGVEFVNTAAGKQTVRIENNTFSGLARINVDGETSAAKREVFINNNIFASSGSDVVINIEDATATIAQVDFNCYYSEGQTSTSWDLAAITGLGNRDFVQLQAAGYEAGGYFGNPGLTDISSTGSSADLTITSSSPLIDIGQDNSARFTDDYAGVTRSSWDVGAYEYVASGGSAPTAPNNPAASASSSSTINFTWTDASSDEDGFSVETSPDNSTWTVYETTAANTTGVTITNLPASAQRYMRVRAFNGAGASSYTTAVNATTNAAIVHGRKISGGMRLAP